MIKGFLVLAVASLLGASAQAALQDYAGSYNGKFEGTAGRLVIGVAGNELTAKFVANQSSGDDVLGGACGATIGSMINMDIDDGTKIDSATFSFDAGNCASEVQGRVFTVDFKHKHGTPVSLTASVFARTETVWENQCYGGAADGTIHCQQVPRTEYVYAAGKFKK